MDRATFKIESSPAAENVTTEINTRGVIASCPAGGNKPEGRATEIPWGRPGSGCTLMLESLVMALFRPMPLKAAAAILRGCDSRLWRLVKAKPASSTAPQETSAGKGLKCRNLFTDPEGSIGLPAGDGVAAKAPAEEQAAGKGKGKIPTVASIDCTKALLAAIEALLQAATKADDFQLHKDGDARGRVSAEEAMLYPGESRAPPDRST